MWLCLVGRTGGELGHLNSVRFLSKLEPNHKSNRTGPTEHIGSRFFRPVPTVLNSCWSARNQSKPVLTSLGRPGTSPERLLTIQAMINFHMWRNDRKPAWEAASLTSCYIIHGSSSYKYHFFLNLAQWMWFWLWKYPYVWAGIVWKERTSSSLMMPCRPRMNLKKMDILLHHSQNHCIAYEIRAYKTFWGFEMSGWYGGSPWALKGWGEQVISREWMMCLV